MTYGIKPSDRLPALLHDSPLGKRARRCLQSVLRKGGLVAPLHQGLCSAQAIVDQAPNFLRIFDKSRSLALDPKEVSEWLRFRNLITHLKFENTPNAIHSNEYKVSFIFVIFF